MDVTEQLCFGVVSVENRVSQIRRCAFEMGGKIYCSQADFTSELLNVEFGFFWGK